MLLSDMKIRSCKFLPEGSAFLIAEPTSDERREYLRNKDFFGEDIARERMMSSMSSRGVVIHNLGEAICP